MTIIAAKQSYKALSIICRLFAFCWSYCMLLLFYDQDAVELLKDGIDLFTDADNALTSLLSYPLYSTLAR